MIAASEQLPAYLLKRITVADGARPCLGAVAPLKALARTGATVDYTCPGSVGTVTVAVRMLTGLWMVRRHLHAAGHSHDHTHGHTHGHGHTHTHSHDHVKRPGLFLLGISGGLTPSPAAFLVLATGLFIGRAGFALLLVLTFGLGMAVVLFGVGILAVAGSSLVTRGAQSRAILGLATRVAPVLAASGITLFGAGLVTVAAIHLVTLA